MKAMIIYSYSITLYISCHEGYTIAVIECGRTQCFSYSYNKVGEHGVSHIVTIRWENTAFLL